MLKVGVTGGIGSGKTLVCRLFHLLGVPVFYADEAARWLMDHDAPLMDGIRLLLGSEVYASGRLDREMVAKMVFSDPEQLQRLNALVHPATLRYTVQWMEEQRAPYAIKEAAIFFESGTYQQMDLMVGVFAPAETRIQRAMQRTAATREDILSRMARQMDEEEKMKRCDYVITNDGQTAVIPQVLRLHQQLLEKAAG